MDDFSPIETGVVRRDDCMYMVNGNGKVIELSKRGGAPTVVATVQLKLDGRYQYFVRKDGRIGRVRRAEPSAPTEPTLRAIAAPSTWFRLAGASRLAARTSAPLVDKIVAFDARLQTSPDECALGELDEPMAAIDLLCVLMPLTGLFPALNAAAIADRVRSWLPSAIAGAEGHAHPLHLQFRQHVVERTLARFVALASGGR